MEQDRSSDAKPEDCTKSTSSSSLSETSDLSDAAKYAFAGLAANILAELFSGDKEKEFRRKLLEDLMSSIELPKRAWQSNLSVADGEWQTKPEPFIDQLLDDKVVQENPTSLLTSLLLVAIHDGKYDARVRVVLEHMCWLLRVEISSIETIEDQMLAVLKNRATLSEEEKQEAAKKSRRSKIKRGALIGLATVVGGTIIGVTGGLAAPLIATGVGAIIGTAGGAALGSMAGVAVIGSLFGVAGAGLTGYKMKNRVGGIEQFEFDVLSEGSQMTVTLAISGWISKKGNEDFRTPWLSLNNGKEQYYLKYEGKYLQDLGQSLETLYNMMVKQAITEGLKYTALNTLLAAVAWPATLLSISNVIDNPWNVATHRAENAGKQLANVLISRQHGHRPMTLVGFSLGARVIFHCLKELARHPKGAGIIENAYLLGAPVTGNPKEWEVFEDVVAGRIVNAYIRHDWMLKFVYRTASVQYKIAGTAPVQWDNRRMINMDLTNVVNGHMDYMKKMPTVLAAVGLKTKEVLNVFIPNSDSGYSTHSEASHSAAENPETAALLVDVSQSKESLPEAVDTLPRSSLPPHPAYAKNQEEVATGLCAYQKLSEEIPATQSHTACPDSKNEDNGSLYTDSDKSLAEQLAYTSLTEKGSSDDSMTALHSIPIVKQKTRLPDHVGATRKSVGSSDCILGDLPAHGQNRLLDDTSDHEQSSVDNVTVTKGKDN